MSHTPHTTHGNISHICRTLKEEDQYPDHDLVEHDPEVDQNMTLLEAKQKAMEEQMEIQRVGVCGCVCAYNIMFAATETTTGADGTFECIA